MTSRNTIYITILLLAGSLGLATPATTQIAGVPEDDAYALVDQLLAVEGGAVTDNEWVTPGVCSGYFTDGLSVGAGFLIDSGIILSSGSVVSIAPPNVSTETTTVLGELGDPFLDALIGGTTYDACVLEFDFWCPSGSAGSNVSFRYNFASEEYNEWVGSQFNDVFGFQLNGTNIALIPGMLVPVAINNVNNGLNAGLYNDNDLGPDYPEPHPYAIEADGYVSTLVATGSANLPVNHIKLAIADTDDAVLDSWVMIESGSFECVVQMRVDVKPGSNPNCVNPKPKGVVAVAFFGSAEVDVALIDQAALTWAGALAERCSEDDVDGDGIVDLVCHFKKSYMTGLPQPGDDCIFVPVSGTLLNGTRWEGLDHVCIPGEPTCEAGTPVPTP